MQVSHLGQILVVDDEVELMNVLCERLSSQGYRVSGHSGGAEALEALKQEDFDLLLCDLMMPGMGGIEVLQAGLEIDPHLVGVMMTGQGSIESAVEAMRLGAFDYILKPFKVQELLPVLSRAMELRRLRLENVELRQTVAIHDLTAMVASTLDLNLVLDKTAEAALQQCQADEVSILLPTAAGDEFYVAVVRGEQRAHLLGERVSVGQGIAGWVASHGEPLLLHGQVDDPRFVPLRPRPEICSALSMPMMVGGALVGVLNVNATHRRRPFTPGEMKALRILTSIGGAALKSASLFAQAHTAEQQYRDIFEQSMEGIFQAAPEGVFLSANPALARMVGYQTPEEMLAAVADIPKQFYVDSGRRAEFKRRIEAEGKVKDFEAQIWHRDGHKIWALISARCVRDAEGRVRYYEGMVEDVSARKRQEQEGQALARVREQVWKMRRPEDIDRVLAEVKDNLLSAEIPLGACGVNLIEETEDSAQVRSRSMSWQGQWTAPDPTEGQDLILQFWRSRTPAYRRDLHREDAYGEREHLERYFQRPVRSVLDVPFSHGTLALNSEQPNAFSEQDIGFLQELGAVLTEGFQRLDDLQGLARTEAQLHRAQRLESLGRLAGGVAHDFNNLITVIDGYSRMALKQLPQENSLLRSAVEEIQRAGERAETLVRQLMTFSRRQSSARQTLDLNQMVSGVEKMLRRLISEDVELQVALAPETGTLEADPGQLEQVLMNLVVNARDAMPEGGQLTIGTALCQLDEPTASNLGLAAGGQYCRLVVADTGVGMSPEVQQHIFEPFFTTKEAGKGTGLGLATVYGIVKKHQGGIQVCSQPGKGTTFAIYLPGGAAGEHEQDPPPRELGLPRGSETILLVEDEGNLRQLLCRLLGELGYTVLVADRGDTALQTASNHPQTIALLLTDVVLPGLNGYALAAQVATLRPGTKTLYMSGYAEGVERPQGPEAPFLAKPFTLANLSRAVRQALDGPPLHPEEGPEDHE